MSILNDFGDSLAISVNLSRVEVVNVEGHPFWNNLSEWNQSPSGTAREPNLQVDITAPLSPARVNTAQGVLLRNGPSVEDGAVQSLHVTEDGEFPVGSLQTAKCQPGLVPGHSAWMFSESTAAEEATPCGTSWQTSLSQHVSRRDPGMNERSSYREIFHPESSCTSDKKLLQLKILDRKSCADFRDVLGATDQNIVMKIEEYWRNYKRYDHIEEKVIKLLNETSLRLKRRRRLGSDMPESQKKQIRALRNRERSQAIRGHLRQRLQGLEVVNEQLRICNSAIRLMINCLLEDETALAVLYKYLESHKCSESMFSFLSHEEQ